MRYFLITILAVVIQATTAAAWGPNGHRITAQIGEDNLNDAAAERLEDITQGRSLALMATWPDYVRSYSEYDCLKPMHFLTVEDGQDINTALAKRPFGSGACKMDSFNALNMPANVVDAIHYFADIVGGDAGKAADFEQMLSANGAAPYNGSIAQTALLLLVHFVGDVHQPLHVGRGPDRGGNTITVEWFSEYVNLHKVWDELLIEREALSYSEYAAFLEQRFAGTGVAGNGTKPLAWAQESVGHRDQVYDFGPASAYNVPRLQYKYAADQDELIKTRLYQGGVRLSQILNAVLGD